MLEVANAVICYCECVACRCGGIMPLLDFAGGLHARVRFRVEARVAYRKETR